MGGGSRPTSSPRRLLPRSGTCRARWCWAWRGWWRSICSPTSPYLRVLGASGLAASTAPAADVMGRVLGPAGRRLISAGIALSTFGFLNLVILVTPRVFQAMAADGVFLPWLARLHPVYRTPPGAIAFTGTWS